MRHTAPQSAIVKKTIPIVYEDETLCIVDKPSGIPVQGGARVSVCLTDILKRQLESEIFPVHRLDKETSGLLVIAKNAAAARVCRTLFDSQTVEKEYIAVCFGGLKGNTDNKCPSKGIIDTPIMENGALRQALSEYSILAETDKYSLFSVRLHSGRMHQIRIHLAGIGYPIIGDDKHGNFLLNKQLWKTARIKKLQLCACRLRFPINGKNRLFTVPLPDHMQTAIEALIGLPYGKPL